VAVRQGGSTLGAAIWVWHVSLSSLSARSGCDKDAFPFTALSQPIGLLGKASDAMSRLRGSKPVSGAQVRLRNNNVDLGR
jgi:hypothetical protein